ncbi:MAG TPA: methyltransferase domain-containing protein [Dongiaceae bacterium]|nr:methyltransferase domain-containing protein [Dongiaceae bacterium]
MRFPEFWRLYLHAHQLPGTRALHYFATAFGILSAAEAVAARQPLIFVAGIAVSYGIAISAHWFIEGNQPLIRISVFWGAVADLRMCWLAMTGRMAGELSRNRIARPSPRGGNSSPDGAVAARNPRDDVPRYALLLASAAGLVVTLMDLRDLFEPMEVLPYPAVQVGAPIIAFLGALILASTTLVLARRDVALTVAAGASPTVNDGSLKRATLALLAFGLAAYGLAELLEHGFTSPHLFAAGTLLVALGCVGSALLWPLFAGRARPASSSDIPVPATRGLRVDGRAKWVDFLESALSFGHRQQILAATLAAGAPVAGGRLVDVGCGTGELAMAAAHKGAATATGIDATPAMIDIAQGRARADRSNAQFQVAIAETLPFPDGTADIVTSTYFFHHLPSDVKRQALREMWRVLAPGGRLVITDYGRPRGAIGWIASFPMRFNFHEYVRGQLAGELELIIAGEGLGHAEIARRFLGYITVLRITKPR